ncbi:MAG: hypothetical protein COZ18_10070 [Flexibacter sp. CG_4_10_14_3_um_filter_32_15]|nr:MAG: hypothetical protein COZ18_10070 [Flexibacter sp. CG_4_10_14_3_um_filter_32_15]
MGIWEKSYDPAYKKVIKVYDRYGKDISSQHVAEDSLGWDDAGNHKTKVYISRSVPAGARVVIKSYVHGELRSTNEI